MRCLAAVLAATTLACGASKPPQSDLDDAKAKVQAVLAGSNVALQALEMLSLLPSYQCGEPRGTVVGKAVDQLRAAYPVPATGPGCGTVTTAAGATGDTVSLEFPTAGCKVRGHTWAGTATFQYAQLGDAIDRYDLAGDLRALSIDNRLIPARVGYTVCDGLTRYSVMAEGTVPGHNNLQFTIDGNVGVRDGLPVIGDKEILIDGPGTLTSSAGTDRLTLTDLDYVIGNYLPKTGTILLETAKGRTIKAVFTEGDWSLGQMQITVDDYAPVTLPVLN